MCLPTPPKIEPLKLPDPPRISDKPPDPPIVAAPDSIENKAKGRSALRIDLAAGNTGLGRSGLNI